MDRDRGYKEFDTDLENSLLDRGYTIHEIGGSLSRPDIIAIKNKTALIIETKSEEEQKYRDCLTYLDPERNDNKHEEYRAWRKYCKQFVDDKVVIWKIAIWMVHINLQALYYPEFFHKSGDSKSYYWNLKDKKVNVEFENYLWIPVLAFPEIFKEHVQEAVRLMRIAIDEGAFMKLGKGQLLLKFDSGQKMIEPTSNVENSES